MTILRMLALALAALAMSLTLAVAILPSDASPTPADPALNAEEQEFVVLINEYRDEHGLQPLAIDGELQDSSYWMSKDMGVKEYFSHTDSLGRDPWARLRAFDYGYNTWMGENLAVGYSSAAEVFEAWKDSPAHNVNMLGSDYVTMGVSRVYVPGSPYGWYWTNDFGGEYSGASPAGDAYSLTLTEGR